MIKSKPIDPASLAKYFFYGFVPAPATIFKGVKKPLSVYRQLDYSRPVNLSREEIKREIVERLKAAIKKTLQPRLKPAVFLSGGIDSGLVAALLKEIASPRSIPAYTLTFAEKEVDESRYAAAVAGHLGLTHLVQTFTPGKALAVAKRLPQILKEPMADPSLLPTYYICQWAHEEADVAYLGDGGDEALAGYPKYLAHRFLQTFPVGRLVSLPGFGYLPGRWGSFCRWASYPLHLRNQLWISPFSPAEVKELTGITVDLSDLSAAHQRFNGADPLDEAFYLDQNLTLPDLYLVKTERASRAAGLPLEAPFLDGDLMAFSAKIPSSQKLAGWKTKSLLREIAAGYLPAEVIRRPKRGFGIPLDRWLKAEFRPLVESYLNPRRIKKAGLLNPRLVAKIVDSHRSAAIWALLVFELWREGNSG